MSFLLISKSDSGNTRHAKKKFKNVLKRKDKFYNSSNKYLNKNKKGKYYGLKKRPIRFGKEIESFCISNYHLSSQTARMVVKLNGEFSLFTNPTKVLLSLLNLLKHAKELQVNPKITYDGYVSFGAIYLIDNLCWEIAKTRKWVVDFKKFPDEERSILSNLRSIISSTVENDNEYMINEKILINRNEDSTNNQQYRTKATEITDMIEKALREFMGDPDYSLSLEIHGAVKSAIGEQFDNILLHASETSHGTLCCMYNKKVQELTILIYNFGKTIAETLTSEDLPTEMWKKITELIINHNKKKLWNFTKGSEFTLENALTLFAIQEGISSRILVDITRGHGLIDFIENCFNLSNETQIAVISGKTAIKIDNRYPIKSEYLFGHKRRVIAFNDENDIFNKPDPNYVKSTGINFNGLIIETTIPLKVKQNGNA